MERDLSEIRQELNKKADMNVVANSLIELENKIIKQLQTKLSAEVENRVETHAESFRDIMTQQLQEAVDDRIGVSSDELQEIKRKINDAKMSAIEEQDKEARRNNIVVYHVPESDGGSFEERKIDDKRFVAQLFTKMEVGVMNEDIRDVIRLGKWALSGNARPAAKPRPLLVLLTNRTAKNLIMDNLYKLKHLESRYKSVIIGHDLSKKERQECKALVEEAKQKTQLDTSGEFIYRVRGSPGMMRIVQIRRTTH